MTALDRNGQEIDLGDHVSFQFIDEPVTVMKVVAISDAGPQATATHQTLILTGGFQIDSLSVEKVDTPFQSETSKYLEQMAKGPPKEEHQGGRSQTSTVHRGRDHPAPTQPKREPPPSHKKTVKHTTKGTRP